MQVVRTKQPVTVNDQLGIQKQVYFKLGDWYFGNSALNIPYADGDTIKMIFVNPTWATNPTAVISQGTVTLE